MATLIRDPRSVPEYLASKVVQLGEIPKHVAVILDGNRRYARKRNSPVIEGHKSGGKTFQKFCGWMAGAGVKEVTAYVFAIENFNRPEHEVKGIMSEVEAQFEALLPYVNQAKGRAIVQLLGDPDYVPTEIKPYMAKFAKMTKDVKDVEFKINFAFCYSAQHELARRGDRLKKGVMEGDISEKDMTYDLIRQLPHYRDSYPVDLLVRTSGETRLSNFLLLETSGAMIEFVHETWPELGFWRVAEILLKYQAFRRGVPKREESLLNKRQRHFLSKVRKETLEEVEVFDNFEKKYEDKVGEEEKGWLYKLKFWFSDQHC